MKKWIWIIVIIVIGVGSYLFVRGRDEDKGVSLITERIHTGYIANSVTAIGTIQPVDTVAVGAQVSGNIQRIYVDFNSVVKKGQLLASLDKSLFTDQVNQNKGNLQNAESNLDYQQKNFNRQTQLYDAGAISKADFEVAQSSYNTAKAQVVSSKAALAASERNLAFTNIYSPIDGTVLSRNVSEGQTVASSFNTPTLFSIARDLKKMQVQAAVDEADIGNVTKGQEVTFTVDAFPNDLFKGHVEEVRLQPTVVANVVNYTTIIGADNDDLKLKPGMTANITIYLQQDSSAHLISVRALNFTPDSSLSKQYQIVQDKKDGHHGSSASSNAEGTSISPTRQAVWVLNGNEVVQKEITTDMNDNINVQVVSGLSGDDDVIDGVQENTKASAADDQERSPFMPSRRRRTPQKGGSQGQSGGRPSK